MNIIITWEGNCTTYLSFRGNRSQLSKFVSFCRSCIHIKVYNVQTLIHSSIAKYSNLRVQGVFHKVVEVCHVHFSFKLRYMCQINVIFGTLKDGNFLINVLASNNCFSYRKIFQNGIDTKSKIIDAFLSNSSKFYLVQIIRKCFCKPVEQTLIKELRMTFQTPGVNICNGNMKYPIKTSNFYTKFCDEALPHFHCFC